MEWNDKNYITEIIKESVKEELVPIKEEITKNKYSSSIMSLEVKE